MQGNPRTEADTYYLDWDLALQATQHCGYVLFQNAVRKESAAPLQSLVMGKQYDTAGLARPGKY